MKTVLVLGAHGFIGKNLVVGLKRLPDITVRVFDVEDRPETLASLAEEADIVFHLAGVNRPRDIKEYETGNAGFTGTLVGILEKLKKSIPIVFTSSIQAEQDNPYGISKRKAENILIDYGRRNQARIYIYRLANVFGKWSRPNYNSVVATFCHNISHGLPVSISDVNKEIALVYIDDVVRAFTDLLADGAGRPEEYYRVIPRTFTTTLGELAEKIEMLRDIRKTLIIPDLGDDFMKCLHATYLSFLDPGDFSYPLEMRTDQRGSLTELLKSPSFGQVFVSTSHRGVIRGNHYHDTKTEKFCVVRGQAVIKLRHILGGEIISRPVSGEKIEVVDIPPGYTHSIENTGEDELTVLFWANEIFNPAETDTYADEVRYEKT